ncbi:hypothetical protein Tco_0041632, partial [Tanacetum coccineum]
ATGEATPKKARKFKKIASLTKKQTLVLEEEPAKKPMRAKHPEPAKKSAPAMKYVSSKNKALICCLRLLYLKSKFLKRSKRETHSHQASGLGDGVVSQPKVSDELKDKTTGINEGTSTILGVPNLPKDQSKSENESWGESRDDDDSNYDDVSDNDGNEDDSDDDEGDNDSESERTESDEDENPNLNQNDGDIKEEYEDEYVLTPSSYEFTDDENEHVDEEEYDRIDEELYKDVNMKLKM